MSISNDPLAKVIILDIVNVDSVRAMQTSFNTFFNTESITNFYTMSSSCFLAYHHSKKCKNLTIEDSTSQLLDYLTLMQK